MHYEPFYWWSAMHYEPFYQLSDNIIICYYVAKAQGFRCKKTVEGRVCYRVALYYYSNRDTLID